jgi:hypothetical protein
MIEESVEQYLEIPKFMKLSSPKSIPENTEVRRILLIMLCIAITNLKPTTITYN